LHDRFDVDIRTKADHACSGHAIRVRSCPAAKQYFTHVEECDDPVHRRCAFTQAREVNGFSHSTAGLLLRSARSTQAEQYLVAETGRIVYWFTAACRKAQLSSSMGTINKARIFREFLQVSGSHFRRRLRSTRRFANFTRHDYAKRSH